ncbi:MAG: hypothetical protein JWR44_2990 [Hymenobacter sp.]|jgi:putative membrane protein|nr:hypothetical protein [Hymenobacter sp.]
MRVSLFFRAPLRQQLTALALVLPLLAACSSGGSSDALETANAQNEQKIDAADVTAKQEADAEFLVKTTGNALLEVELGKLMQARATAPATRAYGSQLVQNRLELLTALRALAGAKKLAVPPALGEDEQAAYHDVSIRTGSQLDKAAMALLVKAQKQDEDAFDDMKDDAYDGDIRGFAAKYLNPVQEQLDAAKETADAVENLP